MKLRASNSNYFRSKNHFEDDGMRNHLVFQPVVTYLKEIANCDNTFSAEIKRIV